MKSTEPEPLWRVVVGDTEPWRRGRIFLIVFAVLSALNQILLFGLMMLNGAVEALLGFGFGAALFWLQFYFIWIGIHWVRWTSAAFVGIWGFALLIWGFLDSNAVEIISGTYALVVASCLAVVPSIYFFAQRQREKRDWKEATAVAVVFVLLMLSLVASVVAIGAYKRRLQERAYNFANDAFQRVFAEHDTYFVLDHTTDHALKTVGRDGMTRFLTDATLRAGDVRDLKPAQGQLTFRYVFPTPIATEVYMRANYLSYPPHI